MRILICDDDPLAIEQIHKKFKIFFFTYKTYKNVLKLFLTPAERIY